jgi:hypothetical protein
MAMVCFVFLFEDFVRHMAGIRRSLLAVVAPMAKTDGAGGGVESARHAGF